MMQLLLALLALSLQIARGYVDSNGYESLGVVLPSTYRLHRERVTWDVAARVCLLEGAHLIVIDSEDETAVGNLLFGRLPPYKPPMAWGFDLLHVGITDRATEGDWKTILGEPLTKSGYKNWAKGEPNNRDNAEHCGAIDRIGLYNDIKCNYDLGHLCAFICEKEIIFDEVITSD